MFVILCPDPLWPGCGHFHNRGVSAQLGGPYSPGLSSLRIDSSVARISLDCSHALVIIG